MKIKRLTQQSLTLVIALIGLLPLPSLAQVCNPNALITVPTSRFIDNGDGVLIDTQNHLMWQKCVEGITGANCELGTVQAYTWQAALQRAESLNNTTGFAGFVDWRLPNVKELLSLLERSCFDPAMNVQIFPNPTTNASSVWSSTPYLSGFNLPDRALLVGFSGLGGTMDTRKNSEQAIRLVRTIPPSTHLRVN